MKRIIFALVALMVVVTMVGCAPQATPTTAPAAPTQAPPPTQPPTQVSPPTQPPAQAPAPTQASVMPTQGSAAPLGPVTVKFSGWTYDTATVQASIVKFTDWVKTQSDPKVDVTVEWTDADYGNFDTFVTTVFSGGDSRDVLYSSDQWLAKWADAGWVVPLEDYWPDVKKYESDISPFSLSALTYKGKLYGLPYYTDTMYFVYNKQLLDKAGITAPPTTWAEVAEQSKLLKSKGITDTPFEVGLMPGSWFDEAFFALIFSEGGTLFDENNQPIFETDKGPVFDMLEWLAKGLNDDKTIPNKVLQLEAPDVQADFVTGNVAFAIVPGYMMRELNTPGISQIAGSAAISMMPGATHQTEGYTRMYLLGKSAVTDPVKLQGSTDLLNFFGGKITMDGVTSYYMPKLWATKNGLGFSINSLWQDPDVEKAFSAMADTTIMKKQKNLALSKEGMSAPWFAEWISYVRAEIPKALLRQETTTTTLENIKQLWVALSQQ
jgi:multiple sugar transport system substrate-binding protein